MSPDVTRLADSQGNTRENYFFTFGATREVEPEGAMSRGGFSYDRWSNLELSDDDENDGGKVIITVLVNACLCPLHLLLRSPYASRFAADLQCRTP